MIARAVDAPALRFLLLCGGGWAVLRAVIVWNSAVPMEPVGTRVPWTDAHSARQIANLLANTTTKHRPSHLGVFILSPLQRVVAPRAARAARGPAKLRPDPVRPGPVPALQSFGTLRSEFSAPFGFTHPVQDEPLVDHRTFSGWSLTGWVYLRDGLATAADTIGAGSQLGGGQAGLRIAYGFGEAGRVRAYARATLAVQRLEQREIGFGLAVAPFTRLPVDVAIEQRVGVGKGGRTALAAMVTGGVSDIALPAHFRLEAYAQAGIVGVRRRDGFADGALVVDRALGPDASSPLRLGGVVAAAVQPGASRVDIGPRLTVRLPDVGQGGRIALDWRHRVVGDSSPESGVALTLAADF